MSFTWLVALGRQRLGQKRRLTTISTWFTGDLDHSCHVSPRTSDLKATLKVKFYRICLSMNKSQQTVFCSQSWSSSLFQLVSMSSIVLGD